LIDSIKEELNKEFPGCSFKYTKLSVPPVAGAVFRAFINLNIGDKNIFYNKICEQLQNI